MEKQNENCKINSIDKIKDQNTIIQIPDSNIDESIRNEFKIEENNIIFSSTKLKFDKKPSIKEIKGIKSLKLDSLNEKQEEKSSSRKALKDSISSIKTQKVIKIRINGENKKSNSELDNSYNINENYIIVKNNNENYNKDKNKNMKNNTYFINNKETDFSTVLNINSKLSSKFNINEMSTKTFDERNNRQIVNKYNKNQKLNLKKAILQFQQSKIETSNNTINNDDEPIFKCLFCDKISDNEKYNSLFNCNHFFCKKCGKIFYEDSINNMIIKNEFSPFFHCPVIDCPKEVSLSLIKLIISKNYYNELMINIDKNNNQINQDKSNNVENIMNTENSIERKENEIENTNSNENYKYLQKNIIDLNSHNKYINYVEKSYTRCPSCQEYAIFRKIDGTYDKCLKCMKEYCKYCHKIFDNSHLDRTSKNHCKVFYRNFKSYKSQKIWYKYFTNLLTVIAGYIFVLTFFIVKIKQSIKIKGFCEKIIRAFIYFIFFIIFLPVILIILPYFPLIISL